MRNNLDVQLQHMSLRNNELTYENAWDQMYLPSVALDLTSGADQTIAQIPGSGANGSQNEHGYPNSSAQLVLGQYNLYNFGRDKLQFDQAKLTWLRAKEALEEFKRSIRFQVIIAFWTYKSTLDKLDANQRSVDIAQAIVDLQQSRVPLGKATATDVSSSTVDLLNAKNNRDQAESAAKTALFTLNILLGDKAGTHYRIEEQINFLPIKVTEQVLYETYLRESPDMKNARLALTNSQLNLELTHKNQLPLPTIQFSGVTVGYNNGYYGTTNGITTQNANPSALSNLDVSARINLTIPLIGQGGFLNHRVVESAQLQVDQNELQLRNTANKDLQQILQIVQSIHQFETAVSNNRQSYRSSIAVLQSVFDNFMKNTTVSRLDIRDALNQASTSEIALTDALVQHLNYKTQLAAYIGVDYLPRME